MNNHERATQFTANNDGPINHIGVESSQKHLDREMIREDIEFRRELNRKFGETGNEDVKNKEKAKRGPLKKLAIQILIGVGALVAFGGAVYVASDNPSDLEKIYTDRGVTAVDGTNHMDQYYDAVDRANSASGAPEEILEEYANDDIAYYNPENTDENGK